jgi:BirA family biotin operon repressor/biotin-[acetyl-CoA-carboxylase] ligase
MPKPTVSEGEKGMEILSFSTLPSTQKYLRESIESGTLQAPVAVIAEQQTAGIGSRDNHWEGGCGNFFASVAVPIAQLPDDLSLSSASIYFSFIMKRVLYEEGQNIWLKWPNDFYLSDQKVGGTITHKTNQTLICGIGINLKNSQNGYSALHCDIPPKILLEKYLFALEKFPKWKQIFSEYEIEFELSREFSVHTDNSKNGAKMSLADAQLCKDGSIQLKGRRVYSLR